MKNKVLAVVVLAALLFSIGSAINLTPPSKSKVAASTCTWVEKAHYIGYDFSSTLAVDPVDPRIIYAGMGAKLYKSVNNGSTWTAITNGLPSTFQSEAIAIDKQNHNIVYVTGGGGSGEGLYMTTNGGASWQKKIGDTFYGHQIAIDPKNHNRVYVPAENGRVYRTSDGGAHWTYKDLGSYFRAIAVSPIHTNVLYAGGKGGLYKTADYGNSWTKIVNLSDKQFVNKVMVDPKNEMLVYMYVSNTQYHTTHFYLSSNKGIGSWKIIDHGIYINMNDFDIDPKNTSTIYIADWKKGIVKSADKGSHWTVISSSIHYSAHEICVDPVHTTILYSKMYESGPQNSHIYRYACPVATPANFDAHFYINSVYFSWQYPSNADIDYFEIKYKQTGSSTYHVLATNIGKTKHSFAKSNFTTTNATFDFIICAVRETDHSVWIHDPARHIKAPSITGLITFSNTATSSKIKITWDKNSIDSYSDYISIFRSDPDCTSWICFPIEVKKINKGSTDFNNGYTLIDDLKFGKEYTITVRPCDKDNGSGEDCNERAAKIFIPQLPTHFQAYAEGSKVHLIWHYATADTSSIDRFEVYQLSPQTKYLGVVSRTLSSALLNFEGKPVGKYTFTIAAVKGNSRTYAMKEDAYLLKPPDKPVLTLSGGKVKIAWDKNTLDANANKVSILKSTDGAHFTIIKKADKDSGEFTDASVNANTIYYYKLQIAREIPGKMADISTISASSSITTPPLQTAPNAPTNLTASVASCSEVRLSWADNSNDEERFFMERKEEGGSYSTLVILSSNTTEYTDSTVEGGKNYYYRIKASNGAGDSGYSNEVSASVPECKTVPNAPGNLTATAVSTSEIDLSWTDNSDNEDGFKLERKKAGSTYSLVATLSANATTYKDTTCSKNTKYYYRIRSFNGKGNSAYSNEAYATTLKGETVPESPTGLSGEVKEDGSVVLNWKDNSNNENGFKVERKEEGGTYSVIGSLPSDKTTYTDYGTEKGKVYWYRVRAFNGKGYSFYSNEVSFTIPEGKKIVIKLWPDNPNMLVNGVKQEIDPGRGTKPVIISKWGRTVVPIRAIVEALGGTIEWDGTERKVTIHFNGTTVELWIDNPKAKVNGVTKWIDKNNHNVKPIIINERTMLPLRFVAESLGCTVDWNNDTRTITITYRGQK